MTKKSDLDDVTHDSASFLGLGFGKVYSTTVHKDDDTYTGTGWTQEDADKKAGDKYRTGDKDSKKD